MGARASTVRGIAAAAGVVLLATAAAAQNGKRHQELVPKLSGAALVAELQKGGTVVLMRHVATTPVTPDPSLEEMGDCGSQRVLSDAGRRDAEHIGQALTKLGIRVGRVLSSPYCRCLETAEIAFGRPPERSDLLTVSDRLPMQEKIERGAGVRRLLDTAPEPGRNDFLITHTGNLLYTFGLDPNPEGVAHVFRPTGVGRASYLGRLEPDEWAALAGLAEDAPPDAREPPEAPAPSDAPAP